MVRGVRPIADNQMVIMRAALPCCIGALHRGREMLHRLAGRGERIVSFRADDYYWRDLGKPEQITAAERDRVEGLW